MTHASVTERAARIVARCSSYGAEVLHDLATYGWPYDIELEDDSYELRCAIQDEAKRLEASL